MGYLSVNYIASLRDTKFNVSFIFEKDIPFIPISIIGYFLVYFSAVALYFIIKKKSEMRLLRNYFFVMTTIHYVLFIIFPVEMTMRPDLAGFSGITFHSLNLLYMYDMPFNCLPSLHVAYPLMGSIFLFKIKQDKWAYILLFFTFIVSVSVVFIKQHYIMDIIGGFVTPIIAYALAIKINQKM